MKSTINITINTSNITSIYDENNNIVPELSKELDENFHTIVKQWIIDNLDENTLATIVGDTEETNIITKLEDLADIVITVDDGENKETVIDILRFIPHEEQTVKERKVINLDDEIKVPPMELEDNLVDEIFEEEDGDNDEEKSNDEI